MRAALVALVLPSLAAATGVAAEDGCGRFAWPVGRERELFAEGFFADVESQSALPKDGVFSMVLEPVERVIYMVPPDRARDTGYGGLVTFEWISSGRWQVTLSDDAWVDAVQNGRRLQPIASTRRDDCPGVRLSLQFEIQSLPLTLQFGGVTVDRLNVSVLRPR
ncbi:hypothetical protein [Reyranella sp.]|uniref:hypothetical protein n=1 Tax=Reyranella sp. TaxID=1929291 RepID=UPI003BAA6F4E